MFNKASSEKYAINYLGTSGLSTARQLVDTTSNEIYSFEETTSKEELILHPVFVVDVEQTQEIIAEDDQAWYWTVHWQMMEREADENLQEGDYEDFEDLESFIAAL